MAFREDSTGTYTFPEGSSGSTVDLGARNTYRYVNATNVYNKGKADGGGTIDLLSANNVFYNYSLAHTESGAQSTTMTRTMTGLSGFKIINFSVYFNIGASKRVTITFKDQNGNQLKQIVKGDVSPLTVTDSINMVGITSITIDYFFWIWANGSVSVRWDSVLLN